MILISVLINRKNLICVIKNIYMYAYNINIFHYYHRKKDIHLINQRYKSIYYELCFL